MAMQQPNTRTHTACGTWPVLSRDTTHILALVATGQTVDAACDRLRIPIGTGKRKLRDAFEAWGVPCRTALVHLAVVRGVLSRDLPQPDRRRQLRASEVRIVRHLAAGSTYQEIASHVTKARDTIKSIVSGALSAYNATNAPQLVYLAHRTCTLDADLCTCRAGWPPRSCPIRDAGHAQPIRPPLLVDAPRPAPAEQAPLERVDVSGPRGRGRKRGA